jgi:Fuc2NAc and GlcNAc transferase
LIPVVAMPFVALLLAWGGVGLVRRYALARAILDHPNERSSHQAPTPRGGGLGMVVAFLLVASAMPGWLGVVWPLLLGVAAVAAVGWWDDRGHVPVRVRLSVHLVAAATLLPMVLLPAPLPGWMGMAALLWWVFWGVSAINVINFMDGIDGLVASQVALFGIHLTLGGAGWVPGASGGTPGGSLPGMATGWGLLLAAVTGGFLIWNRPPARIFMGDVGSGTLGLLSVAGGLLLMRELGVSLVPAFLPLAPLFLDATWTLLRRWRRGERIWEAHRSHLYQRLANGGWGHARVTLLYGGAAAAALPVTWLAPGLPRMAAITVYALAVVAGALLLEIRVSRWPPRG